MGRDVGPDDERHREEGSMEIKEGEWQVKTCPCEEPRSSEMLGVESWPIVCISRVLQLYIGSRMPECSNNEFRTPA